MVELEFIEPKKVIYVNLLIQHNNGQVLSHGIPIEKIDDQTLKKLLDVI